MAKELSNFQNLLNQIDVEDEQKRLRVMARALNGLVTLLTVVALLIMLIPPFSHPLYYTIVGISLAINLVVEWTARQNREVFSARLLVVWTNLGVLAIMVANAIERDLLRTTLFAETTPLFVILAGLLLGWRAAGLVAVVNMFIIFAIYFLFFIIVGTSRGVFEETTGLFVPIFIYISLAWAAISLYQWQLSRSRQDLNQARNQILQNQLAQRDLELARNLQQRLYPFSPPLIENVKIAARSEAARETSGDFYDFVAMPDGRWAIVVADVTGKSIAAALVMVMTRSLLRSYIETQTSPAAILQLTNNALYRSGIGSQYVTVYLGVLDPQTLTLTFTTAGHPFPYLRRGAVISEIGQGSLPLGAKPDLVYNDKIIHLQAGDQVFLLTDGFFETRNKEGELFGFHRLMTLLDQVDPVDPNCALDQIWHSVTEFRGNLEQADDMTIVIINIPPQADAVAA
ncbi:PP2C family protein-serine/threonine phosphatase [Chloroflexus sp.]|uniref:PP2C family protein-serine/threonine phosphatase n=1 Tax=Chloroflexus sp. TaxID=1904827 RepID=UPI00262E9DDF|nr:PP2C family protein-serine/threonine phosphatase [uncultured Chloroflexus sp.]